MPPETFHREIFGDQSGKTCQGKKVKEKENVAKNEENGKRKEEN